jgi:hypothetical protein
MTKSSVFMPSDHKVSFSPGAEGASTFEMPPVDGDNSDVTITNDGAGPVWLGFGDMMPTIGSGDAMIKPGTTVLFTSSQAVLDASVTNPMVVHTGNQMAEAEHVHAITTMRGGKVHIIRGSATAGTNF